MNNNDDKDDDDDIFTHVKSLAGFDETLHVPRQLEKNNLPNRWAIYDLVTFSGCS